MSIKRYECILGGGDYMYDARMEEYDFGDWVKWDDYASLKSEKDTLDKMLIGERLHCSLIASQWAKDEIARLNNEVERLTKLCQATSPDGFIHIRDIKKHPIMGPAWEQRLADNEGVKP